MTQETLKFKKAEVQTIKEMMAEEAINCKKFNDTLKNSESMIFPHRPGSFNIVKEALIASQISNMLLTVKEIIKDLCLQNNIDHENIRTRITRDSDYIDYHDNQYDVYNQQTIETNKRGFAFIKVNIHSHLNNDETINTTIKFTLEKVRGNRIESNHKYKKIIINL